MPKFDSNSAKEARAKAAPRGESRAKRWIREAENKEETVEVFQRLTALAKGGDMDAIKTYLAYVVGKPKDSVVIQGDEERPIIFKTDERYIKMLINGV